MIIKIISLYTKSITLCDTAAKFKELYDTNVLPALILKVIDTVKEQVIKWQNSSLDDIYPIILS